MFISTSRFLRFVFSFLLFLFFFVLLILVQFKSIEMEKEEEELVKEFTDARDFVSRGNLEVKDEETQLKLYGFFKQAMFGPATAKDQKSFWDYVGKAKYKAWSSLGEMSKKQAMTEYVNLIRTLCPEWKSNERKAAKAWKPQSRMVEEVVDEEEEKTFLFHCREGNIQEALALVHSDHTVLDRVDEEGVSGLLWACDRGFVELVKELLNAGADIEQRDSSGLTPLHYACMCDHLELARLLVSRGASVQARDNDGITPEEMAENPDILSLFSS